MKNNPILILAAMVALNLNAHEYSSARPDSHAPINVMAEHTHNAGEWMVSYRYSYMEMNGLMNGDSSVPSSAVHTDSQFSMAQAPTKMDMHMQMLGAMYAPTDQWTLMLMLMHHEKTMESVDNPGTVTTSKAEGWGDVRFSGMRKFYETEDAKAHFTIGLSLPTGAIDEKNAAGTKTLGYPMQLGSGTFDLLPGVTYLKQADTWSWGAQAHGTIRLGDNDHDYTLGNRLDAHLWTQKPMNDHLSLSARLHNAVWGNVDGQDNTTNMRSMMPTGREDMQGGFLTCLGLGANYTLGNGHRLAFEFVKPIYQNYDGYQMERDWTVTLGWQYAW